MRDKKLCVLDDLRTFRGSALFRFSFCMMSLTVNVWAIAHPWLDDQDFCRVLELTRDTSRLGAEKRQIRYQQSLRKHQCLLREGKHEVNWNVGFDEQYVQSSVRSNEYGYFELSCPS